MRQVFRAAMLAMAVGVAVPAQASYDFSSEMIAVNDIGGGKYTFSQSGYVDGAIVTGSFSGFDLDDDGQLNSFFDEITAFKMNFSGNSLVAPFSLGFSSLYGLVYDLDGGGLGDGEFGTEFEGIDAESANALFFGGPGPATFCGIGDNCTLVANFVPEPASWAMLIAGFGLTGAAMRRQRAYPRAA